MITEQLIPTPLDQAERYLGTGLPGSLTATITPDRITLISDYPYDEDTIYDALAALGIERVITQYSPCG